SGLFSHRFAPPKRVQARSQCRSLTVAFRKRARLRTGLGLGGRSGYANRMSKTPTVDYASLDNSVVITNGIHELASRASVADSPHFSLDMAPTTLADRKWALKDIAALWISMAACIPTYQLASSLIAEGMNWWQAVLTIFLGNVVVLIPMV